MFHYYTLFFTPSLRHVAASSLPVAAHAYVDKRHYFADIIVCRRHFTLLSDIRHAASADFFQERRYYAVLRVSIYIVVDTFIRCRQMSSPL